MNRVYKLKAICTEEGKQGVGVLPGSVQLSTLLPVQASSMSRRASQLASRTNRNVSASSPHTQMESDCWQSNVLSRDSGNSDAPNLRHWVSNYRLPHAPPSEKWIRQSCPQLIGCVSPPSTKTCELQVRNLARDSQKISRRLVAVDHTQHPLLVSDMIVQDDAITLWGLKACRVAVSRSCGLVHGTQNPPYALPQLCS